MDSDEKILTNMREVVGCTGLRNFTDLRRMRQDTLEKRLNAASTKLSTDSMVSIYTSWAVDRALHPADEKRNETLTRWIGYISLAGCSLHKAEYVWDASVDRMLEHTGPSDVIGFLKQMDDARNFWLNCYPPPVEYSGSQESPILGLDKPIDEILDTIPLAETRSLLSLPQPHSLKGKNIFSLTLDLKGISHNPSPETTSSEFVNLGRLGRTISPVPKDYRCKHCDKRGHVVKNCPENPGPAFHLPPELDYVCHLCGAEGDHYIYACHKYKTKTPWANPPKRKRPAPVDGEEELPPQIVSGGNREGRLSPWESSSNSESKSSIESSPITKQVETKAYQQQRCVSPDGWKRGGIGWPTKDYSPVNRPSHDPTAYQHVSAWGSTVRYPKDIKRQKTERFMETCNFINFAQAAVAKSANEVVSPGHTLMRESPQESPSAGYSLTSPEIERYRYSSPQLESSASEQDPITPPEAYVTEKKIECPPYDVAVVDLFGSRDNIWVNTCSRSTALEMWSAKEGEDADGEEA
ncbi:hypothetical protein G7Z17_g8387 [Cylindrodendrum hubeiense]|uniref:CCHC-type domain-containing protein n=1 Tax=Cylindrodendrum hubeiense TaxID=595255 RepID=A0A9P5LD85_9HYPO|nr:hypothetical protein G7Z17_g8387 [Cylindrodendrum hubeiense]